MRIMYGGCKTTEEIYYKNVYKNDFQSGNITYYREAYLMDDMKSGGVPIFFNFKKENHDINLTKMKEIEDLDEFYIWSNDLDFDYFLEYVKSHKNDAINIITDKIINNNN